MPDRIKKIAIIGAGPSGLAAAKYLLAEDSFSEIVIYEQRDSVGGVWNYTPLPNGQQDIGQDRTNGQTKHDPVDVVTAGLPKLNTPMYEGLETNLPHMLMQFSDAPFPEKTQLFPKRETVMQYLEHYANEVIEMVRLNTQVINVAPTGDSEYHGWTVTIRAGADGARNMSQVFDAVIAANGHCDWPLLPNIDGLDEWSEAFPGSLHHSVSYKNASRFKNKRVLLVGGGPSAADMSQQIGAVCQHPLVVAQIEKSPYHVDQPYTIEHPGLVAVNPHERSARFEDGSVEYNIDAIVLCTGYAYRFPFLKSIAPDIESDGVQALPLYKYIFHERHPTLAFIETPEMIVPFPLAECQAAVVARVWSNRLELPPRFKMHEWREGIIRDQGAGRGFHALKPPSDLEYMKEMYDWSCNANETPKVEHGASGKTPKRWDKEACWLRMTAAEMKKAFNAQGMHRTNCTTYEELGFHFDDVGSSNAS